MTKYQAMSLDVLQGTLDLLVLNDVSRSDIGFDRDDNEATLLSPDGREIHVSKRSKTELAGMILDRLHELLDDPRRKEDSH